MQQPFQYTLQIAERLLNDCRSGDNNNIEPLRR